MASISKKGLGATQWSLQSRVLLAGIATLTAFMVLTGLALESAFRDTVLASSEERLRARIFMLMGMAEIDANGLPVIPGPLPEPELEVPGSGYLGAISDGEGIIFWQSASSLTGELSIPASADTGESLAGEVTMATDKRMRMLSHAIVWEYGPGLESRIVFHAAESLELVESELAQFRDTLQLWLGGAAACLLILQLVMLIWLLRPLNRVSDQIHEIEAGKRDKLSPDFPKELLPLTVNVNALLSVNQQRLTRYRNGLADLAHSLKTPLAVIRAIGDRPAQTTGQDDIQEQLQRMEETINYQLQRAASSGRSPLAAPVDLLEGARKIKASLQKIYHDRNLQIALEIPTGTLFAGDPGDLAEILGNLGDNASKWAKTRVEISARMDSDADGKSVLTINVDDDGPGIPAEQRNQVLNRGGRVDSRMPGQGIGLTVVNDMVTEIYGGQLTIMESPFGGTRVSLTFP